MSDDDHVTIANTTYNQFVKVSADIPPLDFGVHEIEHTFEPQGEAFLDGLIYFCPFFYLNKSICNIELTVCIHLYPFLLLISYLYPFLYINIMLHA